MKWLAWPRRSGKTTALVRWTLADPSRTLIVFNSAEADRIIRLYKLEGEQADQVMSIQTWKYRGRMGTYGDIAVDNIDHMWAVLLGQSPAAVSYRLPDVDW